MPKTFDDFDLAGFWNNSEYALREYVGAAVTDAAVAAVETQLGFKLPASYVEFMRFQNGGKPRRTCHRTSIRTSWSHNHIAIAGLSSIGHQKPNSLLGQFGSQFWLDEWGYPPMGIYFADCPSAGHDMLCLDYRACGPEGEPQVVHVDQEWDYQIVVVAENFEAFIRGLEDSSAFDEDSAV